ncbi:hypothetical protein Fcan01_08407 [Folsomia candida]|uniref:Uncharacterized protein n=1 Tax=Folsomia candida TaxID=158441 RepID=A0A226EIP2_FOLCA|nr:hypothetical protein Fcan01_08407 [Folsomia candida]
MPYWENIMATGIPTRIDTELKSTYEIRGDDSMFPTNDELTVNEDTVKIVPIKSEKLIQASNGKQRFSDLSSDIRVNNLMENSQQARVRALFDPEEVEIFEV